MNTFTKPNKRYSIVNPGTGRRLCTFDDPKKTQHFWNHIPRRKQSELQWIDNTTGEIVKVKPMKGVAK